MELKNKRILITGGTGLIGSNLAERLLAEGCTLFVTGRNRQKLEVTFQKYLKSDKIYLVEHDASDPIPNNINDVDFIFHAAGPMERDVVMNKPVSVIMPNIVGTLNCLEFLRKQELELGKKGRLIVFSSVTVYANPTDDDYTAVETDTTHAISLDQPYACYAESKRMSEVIAQSYGRQFGVDIIIARFSTVYGFCKNIPNTAFFEFINKALAGENITLYGVGMPRRDNIYVDDAINGLITIAENGKAGEAYNISSDGDLGNFAAIDEIAEQIAEATAELQSTNPVAVLKPNDNCARKPGLKLSNNKLKELGWHVEVSHNEGLSMTISNILIK